MVGQEADRLPLVGSQAPGREMAGRLGNQLGGRAAAAGAVPVDRIQMGIDLAQPRRRFSSR